MATEVKTILILKIGRRAFAVADLAEASAKFCKARDEFERRAGANFSPADLPPVTVTDGERTYRVSYNGRIWHGDHLAQEAA